MYTFQEKRPMDWDIENISVPQLEKLARQSDSFLHFISSVSQWLGITEQKDFFEHLVIVATEVNFLSWKEIDPKLNDFTPYDKFRCAEVISKKANTTLLPFLKVMKKYTDYPFKNERQSEQKSTTPVKKVPKKGKVQPLNQRGNSKAPVNYIPKIELLEKILENVDKTLPVDERVRYVLNAIGLKMLAVELQNNIVKFVSAAIVKPEINFKDILIHIDVPSQDHMFIVIQLTQLINSFVKKHSDTSITPLIFLLEVQKSIVLETEIEFPK